MKVLLTTKLAERLDGVDVSPYAEGDVLDIPTHDANVLINEQ